MSTQKTYSFGGCAIARISPAIPPDPKILNVIVSFPEALKLRLALEECLRKLNKYNLSTKAGKRAALNIAIHVHADRIAILEDKLSK